MALRYTIQSVYCVLIMYALVEHSGALRCYQCIGSAKADTDCQDAAQLLNKTNTSPEEGEEWRRNGHYKDCDNDKINYTMCMIEIHMSAGEIKSYHRDCSDGKTFSFTGGDTELPLLDNLIPNNETTCTYQIRSNLHVCLQLCEGDMCNGPQLPPEPEVVCYNVTDEYTGENTTVCGASTLNIIFGGFFRYRACIPVLVYMFLYAIFS